MPSPGRAHPDCAGVQPHRNLLRPPAPSSRPASAETSSGVRGRGHSWLWLEKRLTEFIAGERAYGDGDGDPGGSR